MSFDRPGEVRLRWDGWTRSEGKIKKGHFIRGQGACITAGGHLTRGLYYCWGSDGRGRVLLLGVI